MKNILLIGGHDETVVRATQTQANWILLQKPELITDLQRSLCGSVKLIDYENVADLEIVVKEICLQLPLDLVISFTEYGLEPAAFIQERFGINGLSKFATYVTRDKLRMRQLLAGTDFSVQFQLCSCLSDFKEFFLRVGHGVILKPNKGSGSLGISLALKESDLKSAWEHSVSANPSLPLIAEEYLEGPEYSVESISYDGKHEIVAITEKLTTGAPRFIEIGHQLPARLDSKNQTRVVDFISQFLNCIQVTTGPVHSEIRITKQGPKLVEANTRPGGGFIWEMVEHAMGIDLVKETVEYLVNKKKLNRPKGIGAAAMRFFAFENKTVNSIVGLQKAQALSHVIRSNCTIQHGAKLGPLFSSDDRQGFIVVTGTTTDEAISRVIEAVNLVEFKWS